MTWQRHDTDSTRHLPDNKDMEKNSPMAFFSDRDAARLPIPIRLSPDPRHWRNRNSIEKCLSAIRKILLDAFSFSAFFMKLVVWSRFENNNRKKNENYPFRWNCARLWRYKDSGIACPRWNRWRYYRVPSWIAVFCDGPDSHSEYRGPVDVKFKQLFVTYGNRRWI